MTTKLRVYGWVSFVAGIGNRHNQARIICAAKSKAECARVAGEKSAARLWNLCETGNRDEIAIATAKPQTMFAIDINEYDRSKYHELPLRKEATPTT